MNHVSPEKTTVNHEDTNGVKDMDVEEIILKKGNSPLGFSIVGGSDHASHPFGMDEPGIFISKVSNAQVSEFSLFFSIFGTSRLLAWNRVTTVNFFTWFRSQGP